MSGVEESLGIALFSELLMTDQLARARLSKALPKGMELSHFSVLNQLARVGERSPAQLARTFHVTRGAMTNTLAKLEAAGHVHIRPDWDDARRKIVTISPAGRDAWATALAGIGSLLGDVSVDLGAERIRAVLPVLRALRGKLEQAP
jgi:DNA-binding MarR family transcriptional regulator